MNKARSAEALLSLDVFLYEVKVGTIVRTPGDFNAFSFDPAYRASGAHPVLSLSFRAATGGLRKNPRPVAGALPAFFANLLPEDKLREAMEKHHARTVRPGNDFDLMAALGTDLPGAVRVVPSNGDIVAATATQSVVPAIHSLDLARTSVRVHRTARTRKGR